MKCPNEHGKMVLNIVALMIFIGSMFFLLDQIGNLLQEATNVVGAVKQLVDPIQSALARVDTICSGGAGYTTA